jgi:class 3 adenylate cyclase
MVSGRAHPSDVSVRDAVRVGATFIACGGLLALGVVTLGFWWPVPPGWSPAGLTVFSTGAIAGGAVAWVLADRISWSTMNVLLTVTTIYIGAAQIVTSSPPSFGPVLLMWPVLWAFAFLPRRGAIAHAVLALAVMTAVFVLQDGWDPAFGYVFFLGGTMLVTAWTVGSVVARAEMHARREREAGEELAALNRTLASRVAEQVAEIGRLARLRRFLSPAVAEAVLSARDEDWLQPHRREIAILFCDLRGFTAFSTSAEPEEVAGMLERFHAILGDLVERHQATVGGFAGDNVFLFFNDPVPCDDPVGNALRLAQDLAAPMDDLASEWRGRGFDIGYGVGVAYGYATLGVVGFDSRREYSAVGKAVNLASRLSDEAAPGEILLDQRAAAAAGAVATEPAGELELKGFSSPVRVYRVRREATARAGELSA